MNHSRYFEPPPFLAAEQGSRKHWKKYLLKQRVCCCSEFRNKTMRLGLDGKNPLLFSQGNHAEQTKLGLTKLNEVVLTGCKGYFCIYSAVLSGPVNPRTLG